MNVLPSPPTDNLYKYMAITSLWLLLGFCALFVFLLNNADRIKVYTSESLRILNLESRHKELEELISKARATGEFDQRYKTLELFISSSESKQQLIEELLPEIKELHENREDPFITYELLKRWKVGYWVSIGIPFSMGLSYFGFRLWYRRTQFYADKLLKLDYQIKLHQYNQMQR